MMRSHTRPWGQCLLCMSRFILVSTSGKPENRGEAQHLSATGRGVAEVSGVGGAGSSIAQQRPGPFALWALKLVC